MVEARPADPGGRWMAELLTAALRRLQNVLAAPAVVVAAQATSGDVTASTAAAALTESAGGSLQDMASLLSALQQMMYDPGPDWTNTCLQAAAAVQARTDPSAAVNAAATTGSPPPGDALAAVLFLAAQYDHPQDDETRGSVVGMAQAAQAWMQLQDDVMGAAASAGSAAPPPPPLFSSRGLTQLLMALVRMGGQPSDAWVATWAAAAEPLMKRGSGGGGFDVDQMVAVLATAAEAEVQLPEQLQRAMVQGLLMPQPVAGATPHAAAPAAAVAAAGAAPGISGPGAFLPASGAASGAAAPSPTSPSPGAAVRSLLQFRQLLAILELQPYPLETDWLDTLVALVEDFRLSLGSRELLAVLRVLGSFRDTLLMDTSDAAVQPLPPSASAPSPSPAPSAGRQPATSTSATSTSATSSRRSGGPLVLRLPESPAAAGSRPALPPPPFPFPSATSPPQSPGPATAAKGGGGRDSAASSSSPVILDSVWLGSLLEDLKVRGGVRGPNDLMQLAQALSALSAPPSLMSYVEVFAVAIT
ncbi:hypothetical protein Vretimale_19820, partial [Volvox reticuliferus]